MSESTGACTADGACPHGRLLAWSLALLASTGCAEEALHADDLAGRVFLLQSASGFEPVADTSVSLDFTDMALYVDTGCDSLNFSYELQDDRILVSPGGATKLSCDAALEQQDKWVASFLRADPRVALHGSELTLLGDGARLVFGDRAVLRPTRPFAGTTWLVSHISGEDDDAEVDISESEANPTMLFRKDGTFVADTTCNQGTGRYRVKGGQLTVLASNFEERACSGEPGVADIDMKIFLGPPAVGAKPIDVLLDADGLTLIEYDLRLFAYAQ